MLSFDFAQEAVQKFYASECVNMTLTGHVDGCFIDQVRSDACQLPPWPRRAGYGTTS